MLGLLGGCGSGKHGEETSTGKGNGKIAYTSFVCGMGTDALEKHMYVINPDGSGDRRVGAFGGSSPNWSPDGTKIAFARWDGEALSIPSWSGDSGSVTPRALGLVRASLSLNRTEPV